MTESKSHFPLIVRQHEDAERRWFFGGGMHLWKMTTAETNGAVWLMEDEMTRGKMTPLHRHDDSDEIVYVIDGELLLSVNGEERRLAAGGVSLVPRGVPHALLVTSETCRILAFGTSASTEAFFRAASEAAPADGAGPVDFQRVIAAGAQTGGMQMLGPPPFAKR